MKTVIIVGVVVAALIAALVAALCKVAGRDSKQEEKEHPCTFCQRWGECNGVDETCPLIQAYEEMRHGK